MKLCPDEWVANAGLAADGSERPSSRTFESSYRECVLLYLRSKTMKLSDNPSVQPQPKLKHSLRPPRTPSKPSPPSTSPSPLVRPWKSNSSAPLSGPRSVPPSPSVTGFLHSHLRQIEKLYGHGYEIIALAATHSPGLVATACKATSATHAVIRLFSTATWTPVGQPLEGHALTITRVRFSRNDRWLLSVSRDRSWRVFGKGTDGEFFAPFLSFGFRGQ